MSNQGLGAAGAQGRGRYESVRHGCDDTYIEMSGEEVESWSSTLPKPQQ